MLLAETDYRVYATFHLLNLRNGTETQVLALYGTALPVSRLLGDPSTGDRPHPAGVSTRQGSHLRLPTVKLYHGARVHRGQAVWRVHALPDSSPRSLSTA